MESWYLLHPKDKASLKIENYEKAKFINRTRARAYFNGRH